MILMKNKIKTHQNLIEEEEDLKWLLEKILEKA